jgi:cytoskeletal protein CcmA (bactofilin family)
MGGDERSEVSVVGPGTRIEGTVEAAGSLRVEGEVKGKITAQQEVSPSAQGRVEANIEATSITLAGRVRGDITSATLAIADGAIFIGRSSMGEEARQGPETRRGREAT